jgi:acetylornithine deacetylase/succinyl-diaminopimelate desuccinylase-like protein
MLNLEAINRNELVELARKVMSFKSDSDNEGQLAAFIADRLRKQGIETHDEDVVAGRPNVIATVRSKNSNQLPLVINAHMDGAYHLTGWSRDPLEGWIEGDKLYGAAIADMKGGLAAMIAATEAAAQQKDLPRDFILQAVMHHDTVGLGTKYVLASEGPYEGYGICGEPSNMKVHYAHGGAVKFKITVKGHAAHVSRIEDGVDALKAAVALYQKLGDMSPTGKRIADLPDLPTVFVGVLNSGFAAGCIAPIAEMYGDIRTLPDMDRKTVYSDLANLVDENRVPGCEYEIKITAAQKGLLGRPDSTIISALDGAFKKVRKHSVEVSKSMPTQAFVTDGADMASAGIETVVMGPGDWKYEPNEFISIKDMHDAALIYLQTAYELPLR